MGAMKSMRSKILDVLDVEPVKYAYPMDLRQGNVTRAMLKVLCMGLLSLP